MLHWTNLHTSLYLATSVHLILVHTNKMPPATPEWSIPQRQTAIVAQGPGQIAIKHDAPVPVLESNMVLVKTAAVAINPVDAKMLDYSPVPGAIHGYDFAGTVVALGTNVSVFSTIAIGDRVAGVVYGMNELQPDIGAFAEYVGAYADSLLTIPDRMAFEDAASLGNGIATAALGLFSELRVPASLDQLQAVKSSSQDQSGNKEDEREFVLVAGGSTATGTRAIQLLKL